ncbi:Lnb N-terminal periplasmic domain-containing protein [Roseimarinus sediminis]|uniref:Lnb N-terminal periplasmic domain-containing protein n=1 Tax=Roseimarinus sediminis TaxID=1610899 RepID=UPI003D248204
MFKRTVIILITLFFAFFSEAREQSLSPNARVVMFTCGPGAELYAGFGHSALWINDQTTGVDRLYNYGTFDFNTPNFYWKFIRGRLDYMLTVTTASRFMAEYNHRKIAVNGQALHLTLDEKQKLFSLLEENLEPENRFYKYDFFYDNCATRIRDIVEEAASDSIVFNGRANHQSFRELLFPYLEHTPWTRFGINLILGLSADKTASPYQTMYLPRHMESHFDSASIRHSEKEARLVQSKQVYLTSKLQFTNKQYDDPIVVFSLILMLIALLTYFEQKKKINLKWLDYLINTIAVLAGLFLLFMWVGTDHSATNYNMNILWLLPAQLAFLIALRCGIKLQTLIKKASLIWILAVTLAMLFWPQELEASFILITLTFALRYIFSLRLK